MPTLAVPSHQFTSDNHANSTTHDFEESTEEFGTLGGYGTARLQEEAEFLLDIDAAAVDIFEPLLSAREAAELLCLHEKTVQKMANAGTIPCTRLGKYWRFRASVLDAWIKQGIELDHQSRRVA